MAETDEKLSCGLCGKSRPRGACHIEVLTEQEMEYLRQTGQKPLKEYVYCRPCWKTLSNRISGPSVIKGLFQIRLRQLGLPNAEKAASRFHDWLVENIDKPRS